MTILEALGIENWPAPDSEKKLLNDALVQQRALELVFRDYAPEVIQNMHPVERAACLKRIGPLPKPTYLVSWTVQGGTLTGTPHIFGNCGQCKQTCRFDLKPEGAKYILWTHCNLGPSKIPEAVVEQYAALFGYKVSF